MGVRTGGHRKHRAPLLVRIPLNTCVPPLFECCLRSCTTSISQSHFYGLHSFIADFHFHLHIELNRQVSTVLKEFMLLLSFLGECHFYPLFLTLIQSSDGKRSLEAIRSLSCSYDLKSTAEYPKDSGPSFFVPDRTHLLPPVLLQSVVFACIQMVDSH